MENAPRTRLRNVVGRIWGAGRRGLTASGLEAIRQSHSQSDFKLFDSCKYVFYKKGMGHRKSIRNRLVTIIPGTTLITEKLRGVFNATKTCSDYVVAMAYARRGVKPLPFL